MSNALAGIRILDLADRSATLAGRLLADLGAEVILVEPPNGNPVRHLAPFHQDLLINGSPGPEASFAHQYYNANKRSVIVDLDSSDGQAQFLALAATADVVLDTARPGSLEALGLGHATLRSVNPSLIQCSVTPFGLHSPWSQWESSDLVAGATSGLVWMSGEPRGIPVQGGADPAYAMAGLHATSAISIALHQVAGVHDAPGVHIDLSVQEATAMAVMQSANPTIWEWHQRVPRRPGLSNALRCADGGYVGHLVRPDRFDDFLAWADRVGIDHGMTSDDWEWSRLDAPRKDNPVAETTLALAAALTRDEFAAGALEADIVCLPVLEFASLERYEQYVVNDQFFEVDGVSGTKLGFVRSPIDAMPDGVEVHPAPALGADQVLLDDLIPTTSPAPDAIGPSALHPVPDPARALEGIRVVDFGWVLAAPIGTRILANFGAEVIRIESSAKPDSIRSQTGPDGVPDPDLGGLFNTVNAGKKSLSVDLTTDAGLQLVKDLIATADVVVNNFRPGAMARMGLGLDDLAKLNPEIVLLNLPGAHRTGPWAVRASMGNILMAASGFNMLTGFEGERPRGMGIAYPDFTSPHLLTSTILAALRTRDRSRAQDGLAKAQELHLTQLTGMVALLGAEWMQFKATGEQPPRRANRDPNFAPHGVFAAKPSSLSEDEWVALSVRGDEQWRQVCELIGQPGLVTDERFATHASRKANEDALDEVVSAWTRGQDKWDIAQQCQDRGVAAGPVEHLPEMMGRDPQLGEHYQRVRQPSRPDLDIPIDRQPAQWVGAEHQLQRAPGLGEHNEQVVCDILGRSSEDYLQLILDATLT